MLQQINSIGDTLNSVLFGNAVVFTLLITGVVFTVWSVFGQYRAITHGVGVVRGKYDHKDDPGAINHFQALSAALSATVGLGNIGGVAVAIAIGGPGAVFWMWVVGLLGMALKMTEVTQSMLYRNIDKPDEPHGGPMFAIYRGVQDLQQKVTWFPMAAGLTFAGFIMLFALASGNTYVIIGAAVLSAVVAVLGFVNGRLMGGTIGGFFCLTLILSAITGGNMFQAWNVAAATTQYLPPDWNRNTAAMIIGVILAVVVGLVILGGIKRIGKVAGFLVPFMCGLYLLFGVIVLFMNIGVVPEMLVSIFRGGLGLGGYEPENAFLGGSLGMAFIWGVKRALFSSEAGQGSAPIAHSAAKCDEPVREGVVAGLEPLIDTIIVCTITALVILSTGAFNRESDTVYPDMAEVTLMIDESGDAPVATLTTPPLSERTEQSRRIGKVDGDDDQWQLGKTVFMIVEHDEATDKLDEDGQPVVKSVRTQLTGEIQEGGTVEWADLTLPENAEDVRLADRGVYLNYAGAALTAHAFDRAFPNLPVSAGLLVVFASWLFAISTMISWSYYGEQGWVFLFGDNKIGLMVYRLQYCVWVFISTLPFIKTDADLDRWTTLGLGAMLVANIPIMWLLSYKAMTEFHSYIGRLKRGEFHPHHARKFHDMAEGQQPDE